MKVSAYMAASIDGYIARENGEIDWLIEGENREEDYGYAEFIATVSCLIIGRNTFEKILSFPEWPYGNKRVIVLSRTIKQLPSAIINKAELCGGDLLNLVERLSSEGEERLYIDGGMIIQSFLKLGLVTDITITRIPILLGKGIPLFGFLDSDIKINHVATNVFDNGFVQSKYLLNA
ncbi:dihydrofolate reductase [Endozoicomonas sp. SM1973]|uniref:Dihydrofolate reductase n=1 Tax=Spartinivicinus marinus TaxID=2994442 RepID=A0A853HSY4_9GAMM|nr:dihydrofolate reductase family protein [Spartinivicinus marinus]MCX4026566.1 dihydrofolate reductase family protein [Spartinivicinus marinus]NYZ64403.1 dihydrofolate reductase [Spartinivicinus marinus]